MSFLGRSSLDERKPIWFPKILLDDGQYFHIYITYKPNVGHYTRVKNCIKYLLISREKHIWWRFYIFVYNIIFPTSFIISSCVILRLVSSFRGPILTLSRRSLSKCSCCTRGSSGVYSGFWKAWISLPKGCLVVFYPYPYLKASIIPLCLIILFYLLTHICTINFTIY
jgi:hypothetical protein